MYEHVHVQYVRIDLCMCVYSQKRSVTILFRIKHAVLVWDTQLDFATIPAARSLNFHSVPLPACCCVLCLCAMAAAAAATALCLLCAQSELVV